MPGNAFELINTHSLFPLIETLRFEGCGFQQFSNESHLYMINFISHRQALSDIILTFDGNFYPCTGDWSRLEFRNCRYDPVKDCTCRIAYQEYIMNSFLWIDRVEVRKSQILKCMIYDSAGKIILKCLNANDIFSF